MTHPNLTADVPITDRESAANFAERLHGLMIALTQHLRRETKALRDGAFSKDATDQDTKNELMFAYRSALGHLQAHKDIISRHVPVKLDELRRLNEEFQAELQKNLATVSTAKAVSEHLLTRLSDKVSAGRQPKTYGASGTMTSGGQAAAISVDRAL
ncbi:MAG: hypothetical protein ACE37E_03125 [Hyphomicrobiales bacterium]